MTSHTQQQRTRQLVLSLVAVVLLVVSTGAAQNPSGRAAPKFSTAVAFDTSAPLRDLTPAKRKFSSSVLLEIRPERGPVALDKGFSGDAAVQTSSQTHAALANALAVPSPLLTFEGISNQDNFNIFGFRVNPPDPNGDVGPNHYVEIVNLAFAVYSKNGTLLLGPMRSLTAPILRATRSYCTINLPIAGYLRSSRPVAFPTQRVRSGIA
jgi:hypothetical protein